MRLVEAKQILKECGYLVENRKNSYYYFDEVDVFGDKYSDALLDALWDYFGGEYDENGEAFIKVNGKYEPIENLTELLNWVTYDELEKQFGTPTQFIKSC